MFPGAGCGQISVGGWVLMGLVWATFLGLVLWALSRLFAPARADSGLHEDADDLDPRLARGQMDLANTEHCARSSPPQGVIEATRADMTRQPTQVRGRSKSPD
jgi:hypothetical protein